MRALFGNIHAAFHEPNTRIYRYVQSIVWTLILASIALLILEEVFERSQVIIRIDRILLTIFAVELTLRVITFQPPALQVFHRPPMGRIRTHVLARIGFLLRPIMLIDMLAVLAVFPELRGLRVLRLLRLFRSTRIFRYRNPFAIVMQAIEENGLLFIVAFSVLGLATLLGGVSIYLIEHKGDGSIQTLFDGIWWALVTITTVGYGDLIPDTGLGRIVAGVSMVAGMFTLALFAGIVSSSLVNSMLSIREEQFRMSDYVYHVVCCGHDESSQMLLEALNHELDLSQTRVVIFEDRERPRDVPPEFLWVRGDPTKESELDKVRLTHAAAVVVSGRRDISPQVADARTILITFTIRHHLDRRQEYVRHRRTPLYVVAEILDSENVDHARTAGANEVIETRRIGFSMIAHAVGYHGTATAMSRVLISGSHNVYIGEIPGDRKEPVALGDLLVEMALSKRGGLVVGIRTPEGEEIINPEKGHMMTPGTHLLYLAEEPLLETPH